MPGADPARLPALAGEMEQAGLIRLAEDGYSFAHDTLRACVYTGTPPPRRRALHGRVLSLLAARQPHDPFALLHHAEQAGDHAAVARYALQAGGQALASFSYQAAVTHFSRALERLPAEDWARRYEAIFGRQRALVLDNHGSGLGGGLCDGPGSGCATSKMTLAEMKLALAAVYEQTSTRMDVLYMAMYLMGMIEDAYQFRDYTDFYVANENIQWRYSNYLTGLDAGLTPAQLATLLAGNYAAEMTR
jgi:hypothetical protein